MWPQRSSAMSLAVTGCGRVSFAPRDDAALGGDGDSTDAAADASVDAAIRVLLISDDFERTLATDWEPPWLAGRGSFISANVLTGTHR